MCLPSSPFHLHLFQRVPSTQPSSSSSWTFLQKVFSLPHHLKGQHQSLMIAVHRKIFRPQTLYGQNRRNAQCQKTVTGRRHPKILAVTFSISFGLHLRIQRAIHGIPTPVVYWEVAMRATKYWEQVPTFPGHSLELYRMRDLPSVES